MFVEDSVSEGLSGVAKELEPGYGQRHGRRQPLTLPRELLDADRTRTVASTAAGSNKLATGTRSESASA